VTLRRRTVRVAAGPADWRIGAWSRRHGSQCARQPVPPAATTVVG